MAGRGWMSLAVLAAVGTSAPAMGAQKVPDNVSSPARDGNIAIMEELCAARKAGTVAAYDLFIARHPDHPYAERARVERAQLVAVQRR